MHIPPILSFLQAILFFSSSLLMSVARSFIGFKYRSVKFILLLVTSVFMELIWELFESLNHCSFDEFNYK